VLAITQLAQTTLRSVIGRMELDRTFEERDQIQRDGVSALDEAAAAWGVKVLATRSRTWTPPAEILRSMQAQITAEREKRAVIATSRAGARADQPRHRRARGRDRPVRGREAGRHQNRAQGEAAAILARAEATAKAIRDIADAIGAPGGPPGREPARRGAVHQRVRQPGEGTNTVILPPTSPTSRA